MPDQRAPLSAAIAAEREAVGALKTELLRGEPIHIKVAREEYYAARAATDEAVRESDAQLSFLVYRIREALDSATLREPSAARIFLRGAARDYADPKARATCGEMVETFHATTTGGASDE